VSFRGGGQLGAGRKSKSRRSLRQERGGGESIRAGEKTKNKTRGKRFYGGEEFFRGLDQAIKETSSRCKKDQSRGKNDEHWSQSL